MTSTNRISPTQLATWCDDYLSANQFKDYCPNGLQVDANQDIHHIVTGVTASEALIDEAIQLKAQAILVHHGYFWKGEAEPLVGMKGTRIRKLMQHGISLIAYHLPLDAHPEIGNNAVLASQLGLTITGALYPEEKNPVGNITTCPEITPQQLTKKIHSVLNRPPLHLSGGQTLLNQIAICTGAAQDMIEQAAKMGCQAFISGEVSERTTHIARELQIDYFACGHHATEKGGIKALGDIITQKLGIPSTFIDISNPV